MRPPGPVKMTSGMVETSIIRRRRSHSAAPPRSGNGTRLTTPACVRKSLKPFQILEMATDRRRYKAQVATSSTGQGTESKLHVVRLPRGPCRDRDARMRLRGRANKAPAMTERVYLDWNATAPLRPEARRALVDALA